MNVVKLPHTLLEKLLARPSWKARYDEGRVPMQQNGGAVVLVVADQIEDRERSGFRRVVFET